MTASSSPPTMMHLITMRWCTTRSWWWIRGGGCAAAGMWCWREQGGRVMDAQQLQRTLISGGDSKHQFKRAISRLDSLAAELAACSNNGGGRIFIGVADNG